MVSNACGNDLGRSETEWRKYCYLKLLLGTKLLGLFLAVFLSCTLEYDKTHLEV